MEVAYVGWLAQSRGVVAIVVAVALLAAAACEAIGAWRDSRVLKQIGRSVDIGGRTLNIHCTGEGSPTVVFVSGLYGAWLRLDANPTWRLRIYALMLVRPR